MLDMPRPRKAYVQRETTRHHKTVWYFRRDDGPRIRLHGDYESPEWLRDYEAALAGQKRPEPVRSQAGTLRWLVERYCESIAYTSLADATKTQRRSIYNGMLALAGDRALHTITRRSIMEGMDRRAATPTMAVCFVKAVRALFKWAVKAGHVSENPADGIKATDPQTDGHHTWTVPEVMAYQARHPLGTMARLALDILLYTGMRRSDAVLFGRQHVSNGIVDYRSKKTRVEVVAPLLEPLRTSIEATPSPALTFLVSEFGTPFRSSNSFGNWFAKRCIEAGVPGRAHGLRKAGATLAAENGASDRELMALFGWKTAKQAGVYTRKADRAKLATSAANKLRAGTSIPAPLYSGAGASEKR